jgi:hypothetical protein
MNETMWFEGKWMQLVAIMLNEVSQAQKKKVACFLSHVGDRHNTNISNIMENRLYQGKVTNAEGG